MVGEPAKQEKNIKCLDAAGGKRDGIRNKG